LHYAVVILRGSGSRGYIVMHRKAAAAPASDSAQQRSVSLSPGINSQP